ncbi:hypothetical protein VPHD518_0054 [Vibrio phage D518]
MSNDFVGMQVMTCQVCGREHSNGSAILINKRLKPIKEEELHGGYHLCEEDQAMFEKGYIALVEVDPAKSKLEEGVFWRTGEIVHARKEVALNLFPDQNLEGHPLAHVEIGVIQHLRGLVEAMNKDVEVQQPKQH